MAEALPLKEDEFAKFYEIDEPLIKFEGGVNEIQHIHCSLIRKYGISVIRVIWEFIEVWRDG